MAGNTGSTDFSGKENSIADNPVLEERVNIGTTSLGDLNAAFRKSGNSPALLETCVPGGISILAWDPVAVVSIENGLVKLRTREEMPLPSAPSSPDRVPHYLQAVVDNYRVNNTGSLPCKFPFLGGFVGFVGYEWMVRQEITARPTEKGVPDMWFGLYDRAVIVDESGLARILAVPRINGISLDTVKNQLKAAMTNAGREERNRIPDSGIQARLIHDFPKDEYVKGVLEVKHAIRSGEVYQVDIAQRIRTARMDPDMLYERLRKLNPSPFSGMLSADSFTIVSGSPERLLGVRTDSRGRRTVSTRPIAGTRLRDSGIHDKQFERALRKSPKEIAEHTMLVDLSRNDIGRVAIPGSVEVSELYTVERYSHVMHLVSEVKGLIPESRGVPELFRALFPGGSITGTPKIRSTEIISDIEPVPRGAYTGSMGYISLDGSMDFNILIRSAYFPSNSKEMHLYAGSGIVQDSNPEREWKEIRAKASALVEAASGMEGGGAPWMPPHITSSWKPEPVSKKFDGTRVLLIDNYDSFTYNLVQYLYTLGAEVMVFRNNEASISELKNTEPTHVLISPGPGNPKKAGLSLEAVKAFSDYPVLGVCLGHQSIIEAYGGTLKRARLPMHGKTSEILRTDEYNESDILHGMPGKFMVGRYHSLIADEVPPELVVTAQTGNEEVMAIRHRDLPTFGVQFHPESILTPNGVRILSNFLSMDKVR